MKRRITSVCLVVTLLFATTSCQKETTEIGNNSKITQGNVNKEINGVIYPDTIIKANSNDTIVESIAATTNYANTFSQKRINS